MLERSRTRTSRRGKRTESKRDGSAATVAMTPADPAYVKVCAAAPHKEAGGNVEFPPRTMR